MDQGGWWTHWRCWSNFEAQEALQSIDFLQLSRTLVDWEHGVRHLLAFGSALPATWRLDEEGVWWNTFKCLHENTLEKIETSFGWTWESNPGPNVSQPPLQPLSQRVPIVNEINNNDYIRKPTNMLKKEKRAPFIWTNQ